MKGGTTDDHNTQGKIRDIVVARASEDGEFRARLLADPKAAIRELTGQAMPDGIEVQVHQETAASFHIVLPPAGRLMESEMVQVFGAADPTVDVWDDG